jgi:hypothetical protein
MDVAAQVSNHDIYTEAISQSIYQALDQGANLDKPVLEYVGSSASGTSIASGNTYLHLAVRYSLLHEVIALLSAGTLSQNAIVLCLLLANMV